MVEYGLPHRAPDGTVTTLRTKRFDGIGQRLRFVAVGGVEYPLVNLPDANPLTGELQWTAPAIALTAPFAPVLIDVNVMDFVPSVLEPAIPPSPTTVAMQLGLLQPELVGVLDLAAEKDGFAFTALEPVVDKGTTTLHPQRQGWQMTVLEPAFVGPTSGGPTPDTIAIAASVIAPLLRKSALVYAPATLELAATLLEPVLDKGSLLLRPQRQGWFMTVLAPTIFQGTAQLSIAPATLGTTASTLTPAALAHGPKTITPATLGLVTAVLEPVAGGPVSPPTAMGIVNTALGVLVPVLEHVAIARAPAVLAAATAVLEPVLAHDAIAKVPATTSAALQVVAPAAIAHAALAVAPATLAFTTAPLAPSISSGLPVDVTGVATSVLEPTIVHDARTIAPAVLGLVASLPTPANETPLIVLLPDVVGFALLVPDVELVPGSELTIAPATLELVLATRGGTVVQDLDEVRVELELGVLGVADFTNGEHGVVVATQQNAVGLAIHLRILKDGAPLDLTNAAALSVYLQPPKGLPKVRNAVVYGEPTLGVVRYVTVPGDLHAHGEWQVQARALVVTSDFWSGVQLLQVHSNLGPPPTNVPEPQLASMSMGVLAPTITFS